MAPETSESAELPDVLILCGGLGTRLAPVIKDKPKSLAEVGGGTFLDILLKQVLSHGFRRIILAAGHLKEQIIAKYSDHPGIQFSTEDKPLGTGGAVLNAWPLIQTDQFIVMNGDSYCEVDLRELYAEHAARRPLASLAVTEIEDASDRGSVIIDGQNRMLAFAEKIPDKKPGLVNAGVYVFDKRIKEYMPPRENFSLEHDIFPQIAGEFVYAHVVPGGVLDIGTPERYELAKKTLGGHDE